LLQGSTKRKVPLLGIRSGKPTFGVPGTPFCASADQRNCAPLLLRPTSCRLKVKSRRLVPTCVTVRLFNGPVTCPPLYFSCAFFVAVKILTLYCELASIVPTTSTEIVIVAGVVVTSQVM